MNFRRIVTKNRGSGKTIKLIKEAISLNNKGETVILFILSSELTFANKLFKEAGLKRVNNYTFVNKQNEKFIKIAGSSESINFMFGTVRGYSCKLLMDTRVIETNFGWLINEWCRQNKY